MLWSWMPILGLPTREGTMTLRVLIEVQGWYALRCGLKLLELGVETPLFNSGAVAS